MSNTLETNDPFAKRLMAQYLARRMADIEMLRHAIRNQQWESVRVAGHNMYGSGEAYGLKPVSTHGRSIEEAAIANDVDAASDAVTALEVYLKDLRIV